MARHRTGVGFIGEIGGRRSRPAARQITHRNRIPPRAARPWHAEPGDDARSGQDAQARVREISGNLARD